LEVYLTVKEGFGSEDIFSVEYSAIWDTDGIVSIRAWVSARTQGTYYWRIGGSFVLVCTLSVYNESPSSLRQTAAYSSKA
jgi:hypothetical protein